MQEVTTTTVTFPSTSSQDVLTEILRARRSSRCCTTAIEAEVAEWIEAHRTPQG